MVPDCCADDKNIFTAVNKIYNHNPYQVFLWLPVSQTSFFQNLYALFTIFTIYYNPQVFILEIIDFYFTGKFIWI